MHIPYSINPNIYIIHILNFPIIPKNLTLSPIFFIVIASVYLSSLRKRGSSPFSLPRPSAGSLRTFICHPCESEDLLHLACPAIGGALILQTYLVLIPCSISRSSINYLALILHMYLALICYPPTLAIGIRLVHKIH